MINEFSRFNLDFCRGKSPAKLRLIYKNEDSALIERLIEAVHGKQDIKVDREKKPRKKKVE